MKELKEKIWPMTPNQSFVAASLFVAAMFLLLFLTAIGEELLSWINANAGLASWVQAIGSIAAIIGALYISRYESKLIQRQRIDEQKSKASAYAFLFEKIKDFFDKAKSSLASYGDAQWYFQGWESPSDRFDKEEMNYLLKILEQVDFDIFNDRMACKALIELKMAARELSESIIYRSGLDDADLRQWYSGDEFSMQEFEYQQHMDGLFSTVERSCETLQSWSNNSYN